MRKFIITEAQGQLIANYLTASTKMMSDVVQIANLLLTLPVLPEPEQAPDKKEK